MITEKFSLHTGVYRGYLDDYTLELVRKIAVGKYEYKDWNKPTEKELYTGITGDMVDIEFLKQAWVAMDEDIPLKSHKKIESILEEAEGRGLDMLVFV